jgi:nucleoside phosphorylase
MASPSKLQSPEHYTVAWIAALPHEHAAATAVLDEKHDKPTAFVQLPHDTNAYTWGKVGDHHVVIASLPAGQYGTTIAATTANALRFSLPHVRFGLMVGIGSGVPQLEHDQDVRLGDVVVSQPFESSGGVVQYDLGKAREDGYSLSGHLSMPPVALLEALERLRTDNRDSAVPAILEDTLLKFPRMAKRTREDPGYTHPGADSDRLFTTTCQHVSGGDCSACPETDVVPRDQRESNDPQIHYGIIASGNTLVKTARVREEILQRLPENIRSKCLCIDMEAAGLMDTFPCIVIRGICDYADSHKNKKWQKYAAATAAAFAKEFLSFVDAQEVRRVPELREAFGQGLSTRCRSFMLLLVH